MAKGRTVEGAITKRDEQELPAETFIIDDADALELELSRLYAEADSQPTEKVAHVYYTASGEEEAKIWKGDPVDYDLDSLARKHGSGKYRLSVYVKTERGNFGQKINRTFNYKLSADDEARLRAIRRGEIPSTPSAPFSMEALTAAIRAAIPATAVTVAPANSLAGMREMAEIFRIMQPPQTAAPNQLELLRILADFARGNARDSEPEPIDRGVNATGMDVFLRLVDRFAPMFAETLQLRGAPAPALPQANAQVSPAPAQLGGAPAPAAPASSAAQAPKISPEEDAVFRLKMGLQFLVAQAVAGNDPATYADMTLDNVPPEHLKTFLSMADPVAHLGTIEPAVLAHRQWFDQLIVEIKEALKEESAPEPEKTA